MKCHMPRVRVRTVLCLAVTLIAMAMPAFAQETTGTIKGRIVIRRVWQFLVPT